MMDNDVEITAGDGGALESVQMPDGREILLQHPVPFDCSPADTAAAVARAINRDHQSKYVAKAVGDRVHFMKRPAFLRLILHLIRPFRRAMRALRRKG